MVTVIDRSSSNEQPFNEKGSNYAKKIIKKTKKFRSEAFKYYPNAPFALIIILPTGPIINDETGKKENLQGDDGTISQRLKKLLNKEFKQKVKIPL